MKELSQRRGIETFTIGPRNARACTLSPTEKGCLRSWSEAGKTKSWTAR